MGRAAGVLVAGGVAALAALTPFRPTPALAAYAYWSYWHNTGSGWTYSGCGAYTCHPADGTLDGWRFVVSSETTRTPPRYGADFAIVCEGTAAVNGMKRVAIIVDFGTQPDAQSKPLLARCAQVSNDATGGAALVQKYAVAANSDGFICRIESYPRSGCGDYVPDPSPTASRPAPPATPGPGVSAITAAPGTAPNPTAPSGGEPAASSGVGPRPHLSPRTDARALSPTPAADGPTPPVIFGGASTPSGSAGSPLPLLLGGGLAVALGGTALFRARRRRSS